jgi:hypothetical protein
MVAKATLSARLQVDISQLFSDRNIMHRALATSRGWLHLLHVPGAVAAAC